MARPQINEYFHMSNKAYQNDQDSKISGVESDLTTLSSDYSEFKAGFETETLTFTLFDGTTVEKTIYITPAEEPETVPEEPETDPEVI